MNETINFIKSRRSIRQFKAQQIPEAEVQAIMDFAIPETRPRNKEAVNYVK